MAGVLPHWRVHGLVVEPKQRTEALTQDLIILSQSFAFKKRARFKSAIVLLIGIIRQAIWFVKRFFYGFLNISHFAVHIQFMAILQVIAKFAGFARFSSCPCPFLRGNRDTGRECF